MICLYNNETCICNKFHYLLSRLVICFSPSSVKLIFIPQTLSLLSPDEVIIICCNFFIVWISLGSSNWGTSFFIFSVQLLSWITSLSFLSFWVLFLFSDGFLRLSEKFSDGSSWSSSPIGSIQVSSKSPNEFFLFHPILLLEFH